MTTTPTPGQPFDYVAETIRQLEWRHATDRRDAVAAMRSLAEHLVREAALTEADETRYPNSLGVVQGRGTDVDRACALLYEKREQIVLVKRLAAGRPI